MQNLSEKKFTFACPLINLVFIANANAIRFISDTLYIKAFTKRFVVGTSKLSNFPITAVNQSNSRCPFGVCCTQLL